MTTKEEEARDSRFYFSLQTERSRSKTVLYDYKSYEPNRWVHIAATYTGRHMKFYVDGAKIGVSRKQRGDVHSVLSSKCKELDIGGHRGQYFRGVIDELQIWDKGQSQLGIVRKKFSGSRHGPHVAVSENFETVNNWELVGDFWPHQIASDIPIMPNDISFTIPSCGRTVCDDPDIIKSYSKHEELQSMKKLRYRVINIKNDDGTNPTVSKSQIEIQHEYLLSIFGRYNISWEVTEVEIMNTSLRKRTVMLECTDVSFVGNNKCERDCAHEQTGNDGGDCDRIKRKCDRRKIGKKEANNACTC